MLLRKGDYQYRTIVGILCKRNREKTGRILVDNVKNNSAKSKSREATIVMGHRKTDLAHECKYEKSGCYHGQGVYGKAVTG